MHRLILSLNRKNILAALCPRLVGMRIHMRQHMRNAVLKVLNGIAVRVEIARAVPLAIDIRRVRRQCVVAVNRDLQLDAVPVRFHHQVVVAREHRVVPVAWFVGFEGGEVVDFCAFGGSGLAYIYI